MSIEKLFIVNQKVSLDELMKNEWTEVLEFGFGKRAVLYSKGDYRLIYDAENERVVTPFYVGSPVKKS